ncbi:hypothetical protein BJ138DRAFT_1018767 [Hygrophoropsis aurantiaca]|uniref:Uncharacterized protein n=1 Tax=Hygrophoropsis aurantiaca TaxID=72124 RepID=A0ACB7ZUF9_9AGAM|nr:hypothetical protein BJ138DRAFT_1018767 [Hygrophoropsis aurantiaca]
MSEDIVEKYVATSDSHSAFRSCREQERDKRFENQALRNRDELLYIDLSQAMNAGDVGRVEASFLPWIYVFFSTGKHKYGAQINKFLTHLNYVYPPNLSRIIRLNMLCNPTGKSGAFRAIDWLVERNNLYTKAPHIVLLCHVTIENGFHLFHRTLRHTHPGMTRTILKLSSRIEENASNRFKAGRSARYLVEDHIAAGLKLVQQKKINQTEEEETCTLEADDFIAD